MFAICRRLRWWQWIVVAIVFLVAPRAAWHFRPLNAMERRLVGIWDIHDAGPAGLDGFIRFTADRRYMFWFRSRSPTAGLEIPDIVGSWRVSDPWLRYTYDSPTKDLWGFLKREWALFSSGLSRTTTVSLILVEAKGPWEDDSYQSTDPWAAVTIKPVSAIDRAKWELEASSLRREPRRP